MTPRLTDDQRQAIEKTGGRPVDVLDPATNIHYIYILMRADRFERARTLLEPENEEGDPSEATRLSMR